MKESELSNDTRLPALSSLYRRLWQQLSARRRQQVVLLMIVMPVSAIAEVASLGAVLPFIGALTAPDKVFGYPFVRNSAQFWGIRSGTELILPLTIVFIALTLVAAAFRLLLLWATNRLTFAVGTDLGVEVYRHSLYQPYSVHASRNSSAVISAINNKTYGVTFGVLLPTLMLFNSAILMLAVVTTLLVINAVVAITAAVSLGSVYGLITWLSHERLKRNSQLAASGSTEAVKILQEGFGAIRDVLLDGTQPLYCDIYQQAAQRLRRSQASTNFIAGSPRYLMEATGMVLIAVLAYMLSQRHGGVASALPVLAVLALGAQRLLPFLQQAYGAWANIVGNWAALSDTLDLLEQPVSSDDLQPVPVPLKFQGAIEFNNVDFRYCHEGPWVLKNVSLIIPKGARAGIVGSTGSGKSTLLDLLMGLLDPTHGQILVDRQPIEGLRRRAWKQTIAHVPQSIYLSDATLAENIAFGLPLEAIDMDRVRQVARQAQIADFIESRSDGYQAMVGERGIRLSGGQRQRIGIARALYKQASVLVFDEATSALDNVTEQSVMDAIERMHHDITILLIAHRLTTVQRCDIIFELEHGQLVAQGSYGELLAQSPSFASKAGVQDREVLYFSRNQRLTF